MASLASDVERLVKTLEADHNCSARLAGSGHWRVSRPGHQSITMSCTPSSPKVLHKIRRDISRYLGIELAR